MATTIAIIGTGMVGGALKKYLESREGIRVISHDPPQGIDNSADLAEVEIFFICVPTPHEPIIGHNLSHVYAAMNTIARAKKGRVDDSIIVIKSTVQVGTTDALQQDYPQFRFVFNPEFLTEATAEQDMNCPVRQVVGYTHRSNGPMTDLYRVLPANDKTASGDPTVFHMMPAKEAEFLKLMNNAFYALKVAFANQVYDLCQALNLSYVRIEEGSKAEPMIGKVHWKTPHKGYRGYGGKCLPKDTRTFIDLAREVGCSMTLLEEAEEYNNGLMKEQGLDQSKT